MNHYKQYKSNVPGSGGSVVSISPHPAGGAPPAHVCYQRARLVTSHSPRATVVTV